MATRSFIRLTAVALLCAGAASCSSDSSSSATTPAASTVTTVTSAVQTTGVASSSSAVVIGPTTPTTIAAAPLQVLVTDDDGYDAAGMDAVVEYLRSRTDMIVTVVAPLTNQSGTGDKTTDGPLDVTDVQTASGFPAKAVDGFPADAVSWALNGGIPEQPDLVVSGSNAGQNYGSLIKISGTIGAAATAARAGIPAIAISQGTPGTDQDFDYPASIAVLTDYLGRSLTAYREGTGPLLVSINVPTCPPGLPLLPTVVAVPAVADRGRTLLAPARCDGVPATPTDDIDAFDAGHSVLTMLDPSSLTIAAVFS